MAAKNEIEKRNSFKASKLSGLKDKITVLRERESDLNRLAEQIRTDRDKYQK